MDTFLTEGRYHFFFGDETGIPLFNKARKKICYPEKIYIGVLVLEDCYKDIPEQLGLMVDIVPRKGGAGVQAIHYLRTLEPELWDLWKHGLFHLAGRKNIILPFQKALAKMGIPDKRILIYEIRAISDFYIQLT